MPNTPLRSVLFLLAAAAADALAGVTATSVDAGPAATAIAARSMAAAVSPSPKDVAARDAFLRELREHCGKAYAGRVAADTPPSADNPFAGKTLVMHVRECDLASLRIPFHVGDDRSRTWVLTLPSSSGLRLKHDHRHEDGSSDAMTDYGGDGRRFATTKSGGWRIEFPADEESQALFRREGRAVSVSNVWALEIDKQRFVYELAREGRLFRVEFDLSKPQPLPPLPWSAKAQNKPTATSTP